MALLKSSNPALSEKTFSKTYTSEGQQVMTIGGAINKTLILLFMLLMPAIWAWGQVAAGANVTPYVYGGAIGGFILAIVTVFKKQWAPVTAPLYALAEGLFLGSISFFFEAAYPGIAMQAVGLTFAVFFMMLFLYKTGVIKASPAFVKGVAAATAGVFFFYIISWIVSMFGVQVSYFTSPSPFSIGLSVVIVAIAALNLIMDFDFIERGAQYRAPKYMEWYAAFGLMVTLIWLYIEILRLLSKLRER